MTALRLPEIEPVESQTMKTNRKLRIHAACAAAAFALGMVALLGTAPVAIAQTPTTSTEKSAPPPTKKHPPGTLAPDLPYLRLSDGQKASLAATHRGKIVVLKFWATWCAPCQPAMADFQKLAAKFADRKDRVEFLTISVDGAERETKKPAPTDQIKEHLKQKGWTQAINGWSTFEEREAWGIHMVPATYIIAPDGKFIGEPPQDVEKVITGLLAK